MALFLQMKKIAVTLAVVLVGASALFFHSAHADETENNAPSYELKSPCFESILLNGQNYAVITGQAPANAHVELLDGARKLGETTTDDKGSFTLTLQKILGKGQYHFVLRATDKHGKSVTSLQTALVIISHKGADGMTAFMHDARGSSHFISGNPAIVHFGDKNEKNFDVTRITYKNSILTIEGRAEKNMQVIATFGNMRLGSVKTDATGSFSLARFVSLFSGDHVFHLDLFNEAGDAVGSLAIPFYLGKRGHHTASQIYRHGKPVSTVVVKKGDTLSSIAKKVFGSSHYDEAIYAANSGTLKDANHIAIGQELILPETGVEKNGSNKNR